MSHQVPAGPPMSGCGPERSILNASTSANGALLCADPRPRSPCPYGEARGQLSGIFGDAYMPVVSSFIGHSYLWWKPLGGDGRPWRFALGGTPDCAARWGPPRDRCDREDDGQKPLAADARLPEPRDRMRALSRGDLPRSDVAGSAYPASSSSPSSLCTESVPQVITVIAEPCRRGLDVRLQVLRAVTPMPVLPCLAKCSWCARQ